MKNIARRMILVAGSLTISTTGVHACAVAVMMSIGGLRHPLCKIPAATSEENVVVLSVTSPSKMTNLRGGEFHRNSDQFEIVDAVIKESAKPLYIVTYSYGPVIWRFQGARDSIARIISLGSEGEGYRAVGYIGAPNDKIRFIEPLPDSQVITSRASADIPHTFVNVCSYYYSYACRPDDYIFRLSDAENAAVVKSLPKQKRTPGLVGIGEYVLRNPPSAFVLPAGVLPADALEAPEFVSLRNNPDGASASLRVPSDRAPIALDPADVFSPMSLQVVDRGGAKAK